MYQTTQATANSLLIGSFKLEVASSVAGVYTNVGIGRGFRFAENITPYSVQADNGPDPIDGVSRQTATLEFEMMEFYIPTIDAIRGTGLDLDGTASVGTWVTGGSVRTLSTGGLSALNDRVFKFTNIKLVSGATVETVIVFYKSHITKGLEIASKSDNDEDPVNVYPFAAEAKLDTSRTAGDQLYKIETEIGV